MDKKIEAVYDPETGRFLYYDLVIKNGNWVYITGSERVKQAVLLRLVIFKGELFTARSQGIDLERDVFADTVDSRQLQDAIKAIILKTNGVKSIMSFLVYETAETRTVKIKISINTNYGEISFDEPILQAA